MRLRNIFKCISYVWKWMERVSTDIDHHIFQAQLSRNFVTCFSFFANDLIIFCCALTWLPKETSHGKIKLSNYLPFGWVPLVNYISLFQATHFSEKGVHLMGPYSFVVWQFVSFIWFWLNSHQFYSSKVIAPFVISSFPVNWFIIVRFLISLLTFHSLA